MPRIAKQVFYFSPIILNLLFLFSVPQQIFADQASNPTDITCGNANNQSVTTSINTALGCVDLSDGGTGFIKNILTLSLAFGGAIGLLLILYGFFILTTSAGMPDKIKAGKEII